MIDQPDENPRAELEIVSADISRKRAEKDLTRRADQLSAISRRLMTVQEEERVRIARELHDELGQLVTAAKLELMPLLQDVTVPQRIARVQRVLELLDRTVDSIRRVAYELRPPLLTEFGLASAIDVEVSAFHQRTGIECEISSRSPAIELDPERSTAVFRVVQEALTNVARHAHATRVEIRLRQSQSELLLDVQDNGRGITPQQLADPRSLGLLGMRERISQFGGTIVIEGVPGRGTIFKVRIPTQNATAPMDDREVRPAE
jgi:signal transduction histidine kinase